MQIEQIKEEIKKHNSKIGSVKEIDEAHMSHDSWQTHCKTNIFKSSYITGAT